MKEYKVRRFVDGKEVKELTREQKKQSVLNVIKALGGKTKEKAL